MILKFRAVRLRSLQAKSLSVRFLVLSVLFFLLLPPLAQAEKPRRLPEESSGVSSVKEQARLKVLRKKGDNFIAIRIKALNVAINRVSKATKISDADRNSLVADLQVNISGLNSLKTKIDAETDLDMLESEVKSIFIDFRIFMVVLPRDKGLLAVARFNAAVSKLESASSKLESTINEFKQAGKDTSEVEGELNVLKSDLAEAKSNINQAKSTFSSMTPERDDEAKSMVKSGIASLKAARDNLKDAGSQARKIISWLKSND